MLRTRREFLKQTAASTLLLFVSNQSIDARSIDFVERRVQEDYQQAVRFMKSDWRRAISLLEGMGVRFYESAKAHFIAGTTIIPNTKYGDHVRTQRAIEHFKKATEIDPKFAAAFSNMGVCYEDLVGSYILYSGNPLSSTDKGHLEVAIRAYESAIEIDPNLFSPHYNRGRVLRYLGRYYESMRAFNRAIELQKKNQSSRDAPPTLEDETQREYFIGKVPQSLISGIWKYHADLINHETGHGTRVSQHEEFIYIQGENDPTAFTLAQQAEVFHLDGIELESITAFQKALDANPLVPRFYEEFFRVLYPNILIEPAHARAFQAQEVRNMIHDVMMGEPFNPKKLDFLPVGYVYK